MVKIIPLTELFYQRRQVKSIIKLIIISLLTYAHYFYIIARKNLNRIIKKTIPSTIASKRIKYL